MKLKWKKELGEKQTMLFKMERENTCTMLFSCDNNVGTPVTVGQHRVPIINKGEGLCAVFIEQELPTVPPCMGAQN